MYYGVKGVEVFKWLKVNCMDADSKGADWIV
jgi:hypothetical protein